jgi:hypothetical protein
LPLRHLRTVAQQTLSQSVPDTPIDSKVARRSEALSTTEPFNYEGDRRGYFKASVTPRRMELDLRFVTGVENPGGTGYTEASWAVEDGQPGALPA